MRVAPSAALCGRLAVPAWGANTMRAEFAVLTGVPESELGYDRFNPYYALARVPLESQVWRLRRAGYRTICLHPFDRRFFRRDLAMPALGFERIPRARDARRLAGAALLPGSRVRRCRSCASSTEKARGPSSLRSRWAITARGWRRDRRSIRRWPAFSTRRKCPTAANCCAISTGCAAPTRCCSVLMDGSRAARHAGRARLLWRSSAEPVAVHSGISASTRRRAITRSGRVPGSCRGACDIAAHELGRLHRRCGARRDTRCIAAGRRCGATARSRRLPRPALARKLPWDEPLCAALSGTPARAAAAVRDDRHRAPQFSRDVR